MNVFEANVDEPSLCINILSTIGMLPLHETLEGKSLSGKASSTLQLFLVVPDDLHDVMAISIMYVRVDGVMSISMSQLRVGNKVLGELRSHMGCSCS